jgi:acetyl-CoA C-acetyltransferase
MSKSGTDVVIVGAARTPVGAFNGAFANVPAHELGRTAISAAIERAGIDKAEVSEVVMGQILQAGQGQNPARQASVNAGIPVEVPAWGVNQLCGSGLRAVALGYQAIVNGDSEIVVAGGQESMSMAQHAAHLRAGQKMGSLDFVDTMIKDGLWDAFNGYHMGQTAENVAARWQITRDEQDTFAVASQNKAEAAQKGGKFKDEIASVTIKTRKGETVVDSDEFIKHGVTLDGIKGLKPAFQREGGTVTAANASGINDGAAAVVLMDAARAEKEGRKVLGRIVSWAHAGVDPAVMGTGPIPASRLALKRAGWSVDDLDLVEANEAFAAQALAVNKDLGWNPDIVNVNEAKREKGSRNAVHWRRHGHRALCRALTVRAARENSGQG